MPVLDIMQSVEKAYIYFFSKELVEHIEESVLRVDSSIPPLRSDSGALVSDPPGKAALWNNFF